MAETLITTAVALTVFMLATWTLSVRLRDVSIVDVAWGLGFVIVAVIAFATGDGDHGRRTLMLALTAIWGLRLAASIGRRKLRHSGEDPRYTVMRDRHGRGFVLVSLFTVFLFQGLLVWVVSQAQQGASAQDGPLNALDWAGMAVWTIGLAFEAIGDEQLARFKGDPANRGTVMDRGLWRYSRHPNYFGEACLWFGFGLIAVAAGAWWGLIGPLVMTLLLTKVSGKDHLERSLRKRPGYAGYVRRTSGFVPLPPRRRASEAGS
ncbi:MAG TPA: DUF1295 domain-containing protein [Solirubrobacteraceae bacterium]|nr:DUF1295 domain-containing protein [Solirubrobacteraceae bacterium]